jgi:tetratricopeptide (TPR) repeat protein
LKGNAAFKAGDHGKAIEYYTYATEMDPKNPIFYTNRSFAYSKMGKWDKSLRDANKSIKLKADWAKGHWRAGVALTNLGRLEEAMNALAQCTQLDPKNKQFANEHARVKALYYKDKSQAELIKLDANELFKKGQMEDAVKLYTKAINAALDTDKERQIKADILCNRAACYRNLYNSKKVVEDCTASLNLKPNNFKALFRRAQAYESLEKYKNALEDFQTASRLQPSHTACFQAVTRLRKTLKNM